MRRAPRSGAAAAVLATAAALAAAGGEQGRATIRVTVPEASAAAAPAEAPAELAALLPPEASMVVLDPAAGRHVRLHPEQAARPLPPCSTFKIPNTLISLGAGAVTVEDSF
ncbi:MAG TPA: hypothetical protein VHM02_05275, partial [Thermoanaerobaculia bacterium]|nr:hypothetical protein [Thermoanaerobaculia bacterium]